MNKLKAIQYLIDNDVGCEEWSMAGMWDAVQEVMKKPDTHTFTSQELDVLLKAAKNN